MPDLIITDVRCRRLGWSASPVTLQANMMSPTTRLTTETHAAQEWWGPCALVLVEVHTADGIVGIGSCGGFSALPAAVIEDHFRQLVIGMSAFDHELMWSKLYRSSVRFGRAGAPLAAIAGIDVACYDAVGKTLGVPVYDLLGGRTKDRIPVYASRLYAYSDLEELQSEATRWRDAGFTGMKQRFGFGPTDGPAGMRRNEDLVRAVREAVGYDVFLAGDAYMGWDRDYALAMARRLEKYDLAWIEEPLMAHDITGYAELCRRSPVPISHGEHLYNRFEFADVIRQGAANILQPDVNRVGGYTEAKKICALAEAAEIPVVPHSNEMHNLHLVVSDNNVPFAEFFPNVEPDSGNELFWKVFHGELEAHDGYLALPPGPGLGIAVNEEALVELEKAVVR